MTTQAPQTLDHDPFQAAVKAARDRFAMLKAKHPNLDYALIARLQADDLVDRELTPQTRASIRIVLGSLAAFAP